MLFFMKSNHLFFYLKQKTAYEVIPSLVGSEMCIRDSVKMEIRAYNNRPVSSVRIISADYDGRLELVKLPDKLGEAHEMDATNWFLNHHYLKSYNSPYDCTGQEFTNWFYLFRRRGHWFAYHSVSRDV
mgnify:CR=1 FL=1